MLSKPANILFLSSFGDFWRGGQKSLFYLVANLNRDFFTPYVIVPTKKGGLERRLKSIDVHVYSLELPKIKDLNVLEKSRAFWKILSMIGKLNIDLIHTDGPRNTFYAGVAAKIKNKPLIWHVRVFNKDPYDRILYQMSTKVILVANALKSRFDWNTNFSKLITIYNGVDLAEFKYQGSSELIRQKYEICPNDLLITATGGIEPIKGQIYLIEACGKLKNKINNMRILLVGEVIDNSYMRDCKQLANKFGILDRVIFTGRLNNIRQILNETDIFVLPSLIEAFPRSIIEAMANSRPVIATDVGGNSEAIENNVTGLIVPPKNADEIAEKISILEDDPKLRLIFGERAKSKAEKFFGIHENVKKTEFLYQKLLNQN
jgi:glycosyltransferase involved in cell wall biosynthesis